MNEKHVSTYPVLIAVNTNRKSRWSLMSRKSHSNQGRKHTWKCNLASESDILDKLEIINRVKWEQNMLLALGFSKGSSMDILFFNDQHSIPQQGASSSLNDPLQNPWQTLFFVLFYFPKTAKEMWPSKCNMMNTASDISYSLVAISMNNKSPEVVSCLEQCIIQSYNYVHHKLIIIIIFYKQL